MVYFMDIKPDAAPDYGALLKDIHPTLKPMMNFEHVSEVARTVEETVEMVALELLVTGCLILHALVLTSLEILFTPLAFLFGLLPRLASYFRGVFRIVERMLGVLPIMLPALVRCIGGTYRFSSAALNRAWLDILGRSLDVIYDNGRLRLRFKGYAKVQEWEPSQDCHNPQEAARDLHPDWFAGHPVSSEALPTSTSRRQWKFSYSDKKLVVEPLTPPITPARKARKKSGRK